MAILERLFGKKNSNEISSERNEALQLAEKIARRQELQEQEVEEFKKRQEAFKEKQFVRTGMGRLLRRVAEKQRRVVSKSYQAPKFTTRQRQFIASVGGVRLPGGGGRGSGTGRRGRPKGAYASKYAAYGGVYGYRKALAAQRRALLLQQQAQYQRAMQQGRAIPVQVQSDMIYNQNIQQIPIQNVQAQPVAVRQFTQPTQESFNALKVTMNSAVSQSDSLTPFNPELPYGDKYGDYYSEPDFFSGKQVLRRRPQSNLFKW